MKICFWHSDKPRERLLADAFATGARLLGDEVETAYLEPEPKVADCDVACMVGVKSRELYQAHYRAGVHVIYFDKGYTRHAAAGPVKLWEYWRVAIDAHHPTNKLMDVNRPDDRMDALKLIMGQWRPKGEHIVLAGSSQKYHDFYAMRPPTEYWRRVVRELRALTGRPIVYRPKPSWKDAVPIDGTRFSGGDESIEDVLAGAHALVTHGSNACFEAVLHGVPCVVLGEAVAKPISSTMLEDIEKPLLAPYQLRYQWLANLAYWQWTMREMSEGKAWAVLRPQIFGK